MSYASDHASAYNSLKPPVGVEITFTLDTKAYDSTMGRVSKGAKTSVICVAIEVAPSRKAYEDFKLAIDEAVTLFLVPKTFGEEPPIGGKTTWRGKSFSMKGFVNPTRPDGSLICSNVVLGP